jgi:hypothetical protein
VAEPAVVAGSSGSSLAPEVQDRRLWSGRLMQRMVVGRASPHPTQQRRSGSSSPLHRAETVTHKNSPAPVVDHEQKHHHARSTCVVAWVALEAVLLTWIRPGGTRVWPPRQPRSGEARRASGERRGGAGSRRLSGLPKGRGMPPASGGGRRPGAAGCGCVGNRGWSGCRVGWGNRRETVGLAPLMALALIDGVKCSIR